MDQPTPQLSPSVEPAAAPAVDPVCGMTVDPDRARANGLTFVHQGVEYAFCGRGCRLEFGEDPARYLSPDHVPSM